MHPSRKAFFVQAHSSKLVTEADSTHQAATMAGSLESNGVGILPQDAPLLNLPGELKSRIFDVVHPIGITIPLRARAQGSAGEESHRFHPASPALAAVCRQLRADFPLAKYYSDNTFVALKPCSSRKHSLHLSLARCARLRESGACECGNRTVLDSCPTQSQMNERASRQCAFACLSE